MGVKEWQECEERYVETEEKGQGEEGCGIERCAEEEGEECQR